MNCPLCEIPAREIPIYSDSHIYLVETKEMKGHKVRVMTATFRHTVKPNFDEVTRAYLVMIRYMTRKMTGTVGSEHRWFIVDSTHCSVDDHFHIVGCDSFGTEEELELLAKTPRVEMPVAVRIG